MSQNSQNSQNSKTINFQHLNGDGSFKKVAGILLESSYIGSSEGDRGKCYTTQFRLKSDADINVPDIVSVVKRDLTNEDEVLNYRLFYNPDQVFTRIKLSQIIGSHLDDYETIWKVQFASFLKCYPVINYNPIVLLHPCFQLERNGFDITIGIMVATMDDKIIGYMVKNEDCEDDDTDDAIFLFKDKETCGNVLFDYIQYALISVLDGGRQIPLRDVFTFTDAEIKDYVSDNDFIVGRQPIFQVHTCPTDKYPIDNSLRIN